MYYTSFWGDVQRIFSDTLKAPPSLILYHSGWQESLPAVLFFTRSLTMIQHLRRFVVEEEGQDFAEYALILGAVGVVAIAVIARYRNELQAAFEAGIQALRAARGG
jgi:Flp pilus assembly pilin Flp